MRERVRRWWREAAGETSKPCPGICALCHGPGMSYQIALERGRSDRPSHIFVCSCCSGPSCKHRSEREQQMDRALAVMDQGRGWKRACKAVGLEVNKENESLIAFYVAHRRVETTEEYAARCCPLRPAHRRKVA